MMMALSVSQAKLSALAIKNDVNHVATRPNRHFKSLKAGSLGLAVIHEAYI